VVSVVIFGGVFWLIWGQIGFTVMTRRGARDFSSLTPRWLLVEHGLAERPVRCWRRCLAAWAWTRLASRALIRGGAVTAARCERSTTPLMIGGR
jgi:hypothetical protein